MATKHYDVYIENDTLTKEGDKLVLVQFPALRSQFDNDVEQVHLFIKPKSLKMKLDIDLSLHSKSFSSRRAELLAEKSKPQLYPQKKVDKNIYTSTKGDFDDSQLFVCKAVGNKLVCRSITDVVAIRSDLTHFDLKDEVDPQEEVRPVSVKFAATDRQNAPAKPRESHQEIEESMEDYKPFKFRDSKSHEAKLQREYLFGLTDNIVRIKPDPDAQRIVDQKSETVLHDLDIKPKIEKVDTEDIYSSVMRLQPGSPRKSHITRSRVKECLIKAKLVSFEEVYRYLRDYRDLSSQGLDGSNMLINIKDIIDSLSEHAVLVQGNWAIKSETLYGDSTTRDATDVTGVSINLFIAARDYLIWLFDQDRFVSRPRYSKQVKLPDHDVLDLFKQLGVFCETRRKWELKLPTDELFLEKFPEVVQRQATFWKVRKANKLSNFFKTKEQST